MSPYSGPEYISDNVNDQPPLRKKKKKGKNMKDQIFDVLNINLCGKPTISVLIWASLWPNSVNGFWVKY